jgi:hypothetical protein
VNRAISTVDATLVPSDRFSSRTTAAVVVQDTAPNTVAKKNKGQP